MSGFKVEDIRFSMSSIDESFWKSDKPKEASKPVQKVASGRIRVASAGQLAGFHFISSDQLVRLSQKDFWQLGQDSDGYYIERLVSDDEGPVDEKP